MPKVQISANQLEGADVDFLSLVTKGANRVPFRFTKGENEMGLDLYALGRRMFGKEESVGPAVVAAVVRKGADLDLVRDRLQKAGLSIEQQETKDGDVYFVQPGVPAEEIGVLKIDDDLGLIISHIEKAFSDLNFESTSFNEVFSQESFFPSLRLGSDMLNNTIGNIMQKVDTPDEAQGEIEKAVDEFKRWVGVLVSNIPVEAFKLDKSTPVETKKPEVTEGEAAGAESEASATSTSEGSASGTDGETDAQEEPSQEDQSQSEGTEASGLHEVVKSLRDDLQKQVQDTATSMEKTLGELTETVDKISKSVEGLSSRVSDTEKVLKGTTNAEAPQEEIRVAKSNSTRSGEPPYLDTAYMKAE